MRLNNAHDLNIVIRIVYNRIVIINDCNTIIVYSTM